MDTQPAFGFKELFAHVIGDMAKAICERNGETQQQQFLRSQAAAHMIMGFLPRDVIEAILAGHCVMFHELMVDSIRDTLRGELDTMRRATRSNIVAMDKAFGNNLTRLERYQMRPSEGRRDAPEARADGGTVVASADRTTAPVPEAPSQAAPARTVPVRDSAPVTRQVPARASAETRDLPAQGDIETSSRAQIEDSLSVHLPDATIVYHPSPETIAACRANPEAMAALEAGDPERFARAMGIDMPSEAYLAAAASPGSPFDRQASGSRSPALGSGKA